MFTTITAKFPAVCRRCHGPIEPGKRMRYGGRSRTYHLTAECPGSGHADDSARFDRRADSPDQQDHAWVPVTPIRGDRSRTCQTCKRPDVLTYDEARRGYQCRECTRADEGPGAPDVFYGLPE